MTEFEAYTTAHPDACHLSTVGLRGRWQLWGVRLDDAYYKGTWFDIETGKCADPYHLESISS